MPKIWQKNYSLNQVVEEYCFGESVVFDNKLVTYDVIGSLAHAKMLESIGVLTPGEFKKLNQQLLLIFKDAEAGLLNVIAKDEDAHSFIESILIEELGDVGKKLHCGRSRNDQVLTALKLYLKDHQLQIADEALKLAEIFLKLAKKYEFAPMPGYTHMQKAMPSSVGLWAASFAESLLDELDLLKAVYDLNDRSPLGAGASYGVPLNIDRRLTADLLGFWSVQNSPLHAVSSRAKGHLAVVQALTQIMLTLSRFAQDLLVFTTTEFDFFEMDVELTSGSSIMPQKQNLDAMEILRAKTHKVLGYQQIIGSLSAGLPSGYNADVSETKGPMFESLDTTLASLKVCQLVAASLKPKLEKLEAACTPEIYTAHAAFEMVKTGTPFRDAYQAAESKLPTDKVKILKKSVHLGGTGNLRLGSTLTELGHRRRWWQAAESAYNTAINNLIGEI